MDRTEEQEAQPGVTEPQEPQPGAQEPAEAAGAQEAQEQERAQEEGAAAEGAGARGHQDTDEARQINQPAAQKTEVGQWETYQEVEPSVPLV